jgi:hypothetical protein
VLHVVAVPEALTPVSEPVVEFAIGDSVVFPTRRAVAVAASPAELLGPGSHLARIAGGFAHVDLLVVSDAVPDGFLARPFDDGADDDDADERAADELRGSAARLGLAGLQVHRLGLPLILPAAAEDDLVAALSELVGFDPEPGLYCLAPADPEGTTISRAARRIAQVYGIPLLRYHAGPRVR